MKLVAADQGAGRPKRTVGHKACLAITKVQLALGEARRMAEQPDHGVANAIGVFESFAEHHVAAAFAVDGPRLRKARKPRTKARRIRERAGMELRISARQPAAVTALRRRLV